MLKKIIDASMEHDRVVFEEAERDAREINKVRNNPEDFENLPRDENGYIIMTEEQYKQYYPDAEPVDDFFKRLEEQYKPADEDSRGKQSDD